jgi:hypothetical protein
MCSIPLNIFSEAAKLGGFVKREKNEQVMKYVTRQKSDIVCKEIRTRFDPTLLNPY